MKNIPTGCLNEPTTGHCMTAVWNVFVHCVCPRSRIFTLIKVILRGTHLGTDCHHERDYALAPLGVEELAVGGEKNPGVGSHRWSAPGMGLHMQCLKTPLLGGWDPRLGGETGNKCKN